MPQFHSKDRRGAEPLGRTLVFQVLIAVEPEGEGYYASCPDLNCIHVYGDTREDALSAAKDAVSTYLTMSMAHGDPIPIGVVSQKREPRGLQRWLSSNKRNQKEFVEDVRLATA